ncbi:ExbD/TolR family protein [Thalassospira marina]|uniref:Biopolymer transporter ExbD n=1 Tax=Thalassospira marina TaxID=2048283 RepID=A0ABM6Q9M5_9PROT|nr:biopolymer transporter ExbD [Thalassospira marina]AUG53200.1 biopolymer transporter ExbD [Thalassospira marina]
MQLRSRYRSSSPVIGLTPLIDVVFILLVFFMLASSFLDWRGYEMSVTVQDKSTARKSDTSPAIVRIDGSGAITLNGDSTPLDKLAARITRDHAGAPVHLQPVNGAKLQSLVHVMDVLGRDGIKNVDLIEE